MPYYKTILDSPFGRQLVVVKADFPERATMLTMIFDSRQIGYYAYTQTGVQSSFESGPQRTTKQMTAGCSRFNDPTEEIWVKALPKTY